MNGVEVASLACEGQWRTHDSDLGDDPHLITESGEFVGGK